jgi:hypothetical protein
VCRCFARSLLHIWPNGVDLEPWFNAALHLDSVVGGLKSRFLDCLHLGDGFNAPCPVPLVAAAEGIEGNTLLDRRFGRPKAVLAVDWPLRSTEPKGSLALWTSISGGSKLARRCLRRSVEALSPVRRRMQFAPVTHALPPLGGSRPFLTALQGGYLVDPASSHMLVSKIKPCMSKYKQLYGETANGSLNQL